MSHLTLIPFGLRSADQRLVDVSEVPQGGGCGCICPSCGAPLIARQGHIKQWHFAHASRGVEQEIHQCEYSFFLSVALMAKQLFLECRGLVLPDYVQHLSLQGRWTRKVYRDSVTLTRGRRVIPAGCLADQSLEGHALDLVCEIDGVPLGIVLERPDKKCRLRARDFMGKKVGVVKIDLLDTLRLFRGMDPKRKSEGFHQALARFLFDDPKHKVWIYHPRQERRIQAAMDQLKERMEQEEAPIRAQREQVSKQEQEQGRQTRHRSSARRGKRPLADSAHPFSSGMTEDRWDKLFEPLPSSASSQPQADLGGPVRYECVLCDHTWTGTRKGLNPCPKCGSHLYRRELRGEG